MASKFAVAALGTACAITWTTAFAQDWNPQDPNGESTNVNFTVAWARKLKGFHNLADVQKAAKAMGKITERQLDGLDPQVSYHFQGFDGEHFSYMMVVERKSGFVGISIATDDGTDIELNNGGQFNCDRLGSQETSMGDHCP